METHVNTQTHMHTQRQTHRHTHVHTGTHMYTCKYTYTETHMHTLTHTPVPNGSELYRSLLTARASRLLVMCYLHPRPLRGPLGSCPVKV